MNTTNDLILVLQSHKSEIKTVTLPAIKNCSAFWESLIAAVYMAIEEDSKHTDRKVKDALLRFQESDSLDVENKAGKLLKRFARFYKDQEGEKLPNNIMGIIGDRLQYFLNQKIRTYYIDFTDSINWIDGQFGKSGSCWFGTYCDSVPTFENAGGWGIRFYNDSNKSDDNGCGRTWIYPKDGMLMCFNSYGVERPVVSKVIKQVFAESGIILHYKAVEIENSQDSNIPYINSGTGFILYQDGINADDLADSYDVDMEVIADENHTNCEHCGDRISSYDANCVHDNFYCTDCTSKLFSFCDSCNEYCDSSDVHELNGHRYYSYICNQCADSMDAIMCTSCYCYHRDYIIAEDTGEVYCDNCQDELYYCETCEEWNTEEHDHSDDTQEDEAANEN